MRINCIRKAREDAIPEWESRTKQEFLASNIVNQLMIYDLRSIYNKLPHHRRSRWRTCVRPDNSKSQPCIWVVEVPTSEVKLLLSVCHDRLRETVEFWCRWCIYRVKPIPSFCFSPGSLPVWAFPCTILRTLDRTSITVSHRDTTKPTFYFGSRSTDREESRTKSHASSTTRSSSEQSEVARLIEYQRTINTFQGNVDTLAQIPQYIVTT